MTEADHMSESPPADAGGTSRQAFHDAIYQDLDAKLRKSPGNGSAAEAHGLLSALACLGVGPASVRGKARLLHLDGEEHLEILDSLYAMVCRDLRDDGFGFRLLLPGEQSPVHDRVEAVSDWCQGFVLGIYHADGRLPGAASPEVREAVDDIREIGHLETGPEDPEGSERALTEIVEFLRVAVQLVHDDLQSGKAFTMESTQLN